MIDYSVCVGYGIDSRIVLIVLLLIKLNCCSQVIRILNFISFKVKPLLIDVYRDRLVGFGVVHFQNIIIVEIDPQPVSILITFCAIADFIRIHREREFPVLDRAVYLISGRGFNLLQEIMHSFFQFRPVLCLVKRNQHISILAGRKGDILADLPRCFGSDTPGHRDTVLFHPGIGSIGNLMEGTGSPEQLEGGSGQALAGHSVLKLNEANLEYISSCLNCCAKITGVMLL